MMESTEVFPAPIAGNGVLFSTEPHKTLEVFIRKEASHGNAEDDQKDIQFKKDNKAE